MIDAAQDIVEHVSPVAFAPTLGKGHVRHPQGWPDRVR